MRQGVGGGRRLKYVCAQITRAADLRQNQVSHGSTVERKVKTSAQVSVMGKLTANTGGKAKEAEPTMAEEPGPEKPDPSPPSFVVSPPVYCPPSTSPGRLTRKRKQCLGRCKVLVCCVLAILGVFIFMGASWYVHKMHREAEKPPCVYGDEHEDCDREKSERWQEWLEKSLWVMKHKGEGRRDGHRMMVFISSWKE
ncbi:hypothetical protein Bbelb_091210 [Branchiostoma belcheri]|nr:hypothetical protein Bbelb_091210 [Branchiostoma belcheri]